MLKGGRERQVQLFWEVDNKPTVPSLPTSKLSLDRRNLGENQGEDTVTALGGWVEGWSLKIAWTAP